MAEPWVLPAAAGYFFGAVLTAFWIGFCRESARLRGENEADYPPPTAALIWPIFVAIAPFVGAEEGGRWFARRKRRSV